LTWKNPEKNLKKTLTTSSRNCTVTHYAKPFGYIFAGPGCGSRVPGARRSHPARRPRHASARQPARRKHCRSFLRDPSRNLQAPAAAAHLVREHREGRNRVYQLNPEPLRAVDSWLEHYRSFWSASLDNLKAFVEAEHARETHAATNDKAEAKELQAKVKLKVLKPVHAVFEGIIDPKQMSHYFISSGSARMEEGKTVTWAWADYGSGTMHVSIKKIEKDKFIFVSMDGDGGRNSG
jgi:hypothetical protein